ncbi:MAG: ribulose-phosphate 3-epimerase [Firmicutes bacterium]|nr:ribulose-phosphate 3-epimerase [Bacillota bacterium]
MIKVSASILASDFARLGEEVRRVGEAGCDMVHVDVMDGHFVPNITMGPMIVKAVRPYTDCFFDVHLMISDPEKYVPEYIKAGADGITIHAESCGDKLMEMVEYLKAQNVKVGCAISPDTPWTVLEPVLPLLDMVLVMTVYPGFGGQKLIESTLDKVRAVRKLYPDMDIQVDGGVNDETLPMVLEAGANVLVMGTAFFKAEDPAAMVERVRSL